MPPPTSTGYALARCWSISPNAAADCDVAVPALGSQPRDLLRQAAGDQAGIALHRRQRGGEHRFWKRLPDRSAVGVRSGANGVSMRV